MSSGRNGPALQRIEELAETAGTTVRNIRVYQEKGLLPPPVRRGRTALYGLDHRRRLDQILRLLDRGYTFATIDELLTAERHGLSLTDLIDAENAKALRKPTGPRRRYARADAEAVAGFDFSDTIVDLGEQSGLISDPDAPDGFFADMYMWELFREIVQTGVDSAGIDRIGELIIDGQAKAAEAIDVVVDTLIAKGMDRTRAEDRVSALMPRAGAAVRLIYQSAVGKRLGEKYGFTRW